ncbi:MAG: hypothetical protein AAFV19_21580 [Pseudomonadota bacterium]
MLLSVFVVGLASLAAFAMYSARPSEKHVPIRIRVRDDKRRPRR